MTATLGNVSALGMANFVCVIGIPFISQLDRRAHSAIVACAVCWAFTPLFEHRFGTSCGRSSSARDACRIRPHLLQ